MLTIYHTFVRRARGLEGGLASTRSSRVIAQADPRPLPSCRRNRIRDKGAATTQRFLDASRGVLRGLMFQLGIELRADQQDDIRDPNPDHEADSGAERAVCLVEIAKVRRVPGK